MAQRLTSEEIQQKIYAVVVTALSQNFTPNRFQSDLLNAIFMRKAKNIFARVGRKGGKTEAIIYTLWRYAMLNEGAACYYIAPQIKQAKEIIWASNRLQNFGPEKFIKHVDKQELRLTFVNDSFVKVDGSDNYDNWAGVTPDLVILDEFRSFRPEFYPVMNPNRAPKDAPLIIIGTPPPQLKYDRDTDHQYVQLYMQYAREQQMGEASVAMHYPSWINDQCKGLIGWLRKERDRLLREGREDEWRREYGAEFIESSAVSIFPAPAIFDDRRLVKPHTYVLQEIQQRKSALDWYLISDPASVSCSASLFAAHDKYRSKLYIVDEIYEKRQSEMSIEKLWPNMRRKMDEFYARQDSWNMHYDEAAAWFANEMMSRYDVAWIPTCKAQNRKEDGISLLKDAFRNSQIIFSDRCQSTIFEIKAYQLNPRDGKPVKKGDHAIDCLRYLLAACNFRLVDDEEEYPAPPVREESAYRMSDEPMVEEADLPDMLDEFFGEDYL